MTKVTIVVPMYNEEEMFPLYIKKASELFKDNDKYHFDYLFVNDGSKDKTLDLIKAEAAKRDDISYISFSRNFGQDPALAAGLAEAKGDVVITMDCDFQDPPELVFEMLKKYEKGYDIVHPQRSSRQGDSWMKKHTSGAFYKFINKISGREVLPPNTSQFKLMDRKVLDVLNAMPEKLKLMRSEVPFVGFKTAFIPFERKARAAGKTKYNYKKMFNLAFHTITASTLNPLDWPLKFGIGFGAFSFVGFVTFLVLFVLADVTTLPLGSYGLIFMAMFIVFALFLCLAVISCIIAVPCLYLKDVYLNTQARPSYIIGEKYVSKNSSK
jgi:glycosyltransferase involved in cell wall biosynthesis